MLTRRQREICQHRDAASALEMVAIACASGAIGIAAMALVWPEAARVLWMLAAADAAIAFTLVARARRRRRQVRELEFFSREVRR